MSERVYEIIAKIEVRFCIAEHGLSRTEALADAEDEFEKVIAKIKSMDYVTVKYAESPKVLEKLSKA